ncbi:hypothetical protein HFP89_15010 [Wenzhouxiangella sp. XN79A]|uniref:hypothetical protein n=1 Tax=Wenzhouxiangella sp. XN79A TaxID=2724193 RepID=UPI00144A6D63|nr:hypothetical protein [Wenzhouxiangella sp. XN79A]NKI36478.1 hypothetical protein [Wenzhouxiangella sp. XN79A]
MLLRRMIEHVQTQNWTAVALDFLIVVAGVFIGLQVANWNEVRKEGMLERVYLERLHDEAFVGITGILETTDIAFTRRRDAMHSAYEAVFSEASDRRSLDPAECNAIANAHNIIAPPHQFPSLEELNASGRFGIIRDPALRNELTGYALMQENSRSLVDYFTADHFVMPLEFPEHFRTRLRAVDRSWGENQVVTCALDAMREDARFLNALTEAVTRYNGYYTLVLRPEIDRVKTIHGLLDERLGIDHPAVPSSVP